MHARRTVAAEQTHFICRVCTLTRNRKVFVKGMLEEELQGKRFLFRSAADLVAVRGAVDRRPLLRPEDFEALRVEAGTVGREGGLTVVG